MTNFITSKESNGYLGIKVVDKITGFTGVITGYAQYVTGCDQYLVLPKAENENTYPTGTWVDCNRLQVVQDVEKVSINTEVDNGPDMAAPIK